MSTSKFILVFVLLCFDDLPVRLPPRSSDAFVIALGDNIRTIDPIGSPSVDAASERVRTLIFNSLVRRMKSLTTQASLRQTSNAPTMA